MNKIDRIKTRVDSIVCCVASHFAVAHHSVNIANIYSCLSDFYWDNNHSTFADLINIHVAVSELQKLFWGKGVLMRSIDQERAKITGIVRRRHCHRRAGPDITYHRTNAGKDAPQITFRQKVRGILA